MAQFNQKMRKTMRNNRNRKTRNNNMRNQRKTMNKIMKQNKSNKRIRRQMRQTLRRLKNNRKTKKGGSSYVPQIFRSSDTRKDAIKNKFKDAIQQEEIGGLGKLNNYKQFIENEYKISDNIIDNKSLGIDKNSGKYIAKFKEKMTEVISGYEFPSEEEKPKIIKLWNECNDLIDQRNAATDKGEKNNLNIQLKNKKDGFSIELDGMVKRLVEDKDFTSVIEQEVNKFIDKLTDKEKEKYTSPKKSIYEKGVEMKKSVGTKVAAVGESIAAGAKGIRNATAEKFGYGSPSSANNEEEEEKSSDEGQKPASKTEAKGPSLYSRMLGSSKPKLNVNDEKFCTNIKERLKGGDTTIVAVKKKGDVFEAEVIKGGEEKVGKLEHGQGGVSTENEEERKRQEQAAKLAQEQVNEAQAQPPKNAEQEARLEKERVMQAANDAKTESDRVLGQAKSLRDTVTDENSLLTIEEVKEQITRVKSEIDKGNQQIVISKNAIDSARNKNINVTDAEQILSEAEQILSEAKTILSKAETAAQEKAAADPQGPKEVAATAEEVAAAATVEPGQTTTTSGPVAASPNLGSGAANQGGPTTTPTPGAAAQPEPGKDGSGSGAADQK